MPFQKPSTTTRARNSRLRMLINVRGCTREWTAGLPRGMDGVSGGLLEWWVAAANRDGSGSEVECRSEGVLRSACLQRCQYSITPLLHLLMPALTTLIRPRGFT